MCRDIVLGKGEEGVKYMGGFGKHERNEGEREWLLHFLFLPFVMNLLEPL